MFRKRNYKQITEDFNNLRMQLVNYEFTPSQMEKYLQNIGINVKVFRNMVKFGIFEVRKEGVKKFYKFKDTPVYIDKLKNCFKLPVPQKKQLSVDEAVEFLTNLGYKIQKPLGINLNKLAEKYPEIYAECSEYEDLQFLILGFIIV